MTPAVRKALAAMPLPFETDGLVVWPRDKSGFAICAMRELQHAEGTLSPHPDVAVRAGLAEFLTIAANAHAPMLAALRAAWSYTTVEPHGPSLSEVRRLIRKAIEAAGEEL